MTIASEITKLNTNLTASYTACSNKGATLPASQNFDNLASTISAIPTGTSPTLASLTVTPSTTAQTITPPSGTDGYNTVQVSAVTASIDSDIVAGNIKSGVEILGVNGTVTELVGTTTTITQNGTYAPTSPSNGFTSVSVNVAGTTPSGTYTITANGTYDVTNYASADVNVSGGGGGGVTVNGVATKYNYLIKKSGNTLTFENIQVWDGSENYYDVLGNDTEIYDLLSDNYAGNTEIVNVIFGAIESIDFNSAFQNAFEGATNLTYVYLGGLSGTVNITRAFQATFLDCTSLEYVDFNNIEGVGQYFFQNAFEGCTSLETIGLNKLSMITSNCFSYAFKNSSISTLSFPALNSQSFGRYKSQFNNMLSGVTGCTVHFPSNLQSVIGSWTSVTSGFGGTNTTVLFDLPATT